MSEPLWHLLQVSDVLDLELASALAEAVPVLAWEPQRTRAPWRVKAGTEHERSFSLDQAANAGQPEQPQLAAETPAPSTFRVRRLPLLQGFSKAPISCFARTGSQVLARLLAQTPDPARSPLICSTPYFAEVAERWPGPVVYWLTDLIAEYSSANRCAVHRLDRRMCQAATLVCPNSSRLERYLVDTAGCVPSKILIVPNATRAANLLPEPPTGPGALPAAATSAERPVAGVIGNLAGNMDWLLLRQLVTQTPWLSWVFVGPTDMAIPDRAAREARTAVMQLPNTRFVGRQPYGLLAGYARSFDVAVLPYRRCEPTYSGSSTRFYEHLAACRPMVSTRGLEELKRKTPLLTLFDTAPEGLAALASLREQCFEDGLASLRWHSSRQGTWQTRAAAIQKGLSDRLGHASVVNASTARNLIASR